MRDLLVPLMALALIGLAVLVHFNALRLLSYWQNRSVTTGHITILVVIFGLIVAHAIEAGVFAAGYWIGVRWFHLGEFVGSLRLNAGQMFYFSIETFTTQGVGDVYINGPLRLVASLEPLAGLILIGWSVSFTFLIMGLDWGISTQKTTQAALKDMSGPVQPPQNP